MIVDAVRSPIGKKNGTLSHIRGDELSAQVVNGLVTRNGVDPAEIEDVQWGCVTQVDEQAWNIGRSIALTAGWPVSVAGTTVDFAISLGASGVDVPVRLTANTKIKGHIVALHNHMVGEEPAFYFLHYWGKGPTQELAQGVKSALDSQKKATKQAAAH